MPGPLTAAQTNTAIDNDTLNPTQTNNRAVVHVTLVFEGVSFNPDNLYDALDAQYGTVSYEKDQASRGTYIFNIAT